MGIHTYMHSECVILPMFHVIVNFPLFMYFKLEVMIWVYVFWEYCLQQN